MAKRAKQGMWDWNTLFFRGLFIWALQFTLPAVFQSSHKLYIICQKKPAPKLKTGWILLYLEDVSAFCASDALLLSSFGIYQKITARRALDCLYLIVHWFCPGRCFASGGRFRSRGWFASGFWLCSRLRFCSSLGFPFACFDACQLTHPLANPKHLPLLCLPHIALFSFDISCNCCCGSWL